MTRRIIVLVAVLGTASIALGEASREDQLTRAMKDVRLVYRSFKDALKQGDWSRMESDMAKFLDFSEKLPTLAPEDDPDLYRDEAKKFTEEIKGLDQTVRDRSLEGTTLTLSAAIESCKACHKHYRNPIARFFDNIFLY